MNKKLKAIVGVAILQMSLLQPVFASAQYEGNDYGQNAITRSTKSYMFEEDFEAYSLGDFTGSDLWEVTQEAGTMRIVQNGDGTQSIKLTKAASEVGKLSISSEKLRLDGIIGMEIKLKKYGPGHFGVPYFYSTAKPGAPVATLVFDDAKVYSHIGGDTRTLLGTFKMNEWYECKMVINTFLGVFDMYLNDQLVADSVKVRNQVDYIDYVEIYTDKANRGEVTIDYIRGGYEIAPELADATLKNLTDNQVTLIKDGTHSYVAEVDESITTLNLMAELAHKWATVEVNGQTLRTGELSQDILLVPGKNEIELQVISADRSNTETYIVTINQYVKDKDATLCELLPSTGTLHQAFEKDILEYTIQVPYETEEIQFTATTTVDGATVMMNGDMQTNGVLSHPIPLTVGDNKAVFEVTSKDGTETSIYSVTVIREAEGNEAFQIEGSLDTSSGISVNATIKPPTKGDHLGEEYVVFELFKDDEPLEIICIQEDIMKEEQINIQFSEMQLDKGEYQVKVFVFDTYEEIALPRSLGEPITLVCKK